MIQNLQFDFIVDKENKSIQVLRHFNAGLQLVWDAWTKPELLDLWWAPKPFKTVTKSMDFKVGGTWLYNMLGPEGESFWCKNEFTSINTLSDFKGIDGFCDENGVFNTEMPRHNWLTSFKSVDGKTAVTVKIDYDSLEDLEKIIEMGFKEGFTMALQNLDELLAASK